MQPSWLNDTELARILEEDVPVLDLTTHSLEIGDREGSMEYFLRADGVVSGTEEAARILSLLGLTVQHIEQSGSRKKAGEKILSCTGKAGGIFRGWKITQNLLEYTTGIATRTTALVDAARQANPEVSVAVTRKNFPGTKKLAIKGALSGGASIHRLGLSESILIFNEHRSFLPDGELDEQLQKILIQEKERSLVAEVANLEEALELLETGVRVIQFEKMEPEKLRTSTLEIRQKFPGTIIAAAGGITPENAKVHAQTGVDVLVTSSVFHGKPADVRVEIQPARL